MAMNHQRVIKVLSLWIFNLLRIYGFLPISYDPRTSAFRINTFLRCYTVVLLFIFIFIMPQLFCNQAITTRHPKSLIDHVLLTIQYTTNNLFLIAYATLALLRSHQMKAVLNECLILWRILQAKSSLFTCRKLVYKFLFKLIIVDIASFGIVCYNYFWYGQAAPHFWLPLIGFAVQWSIAVLTSGYLAMTYIVADLYRRLNLSIEEHVVSRLEAFESDTAYWEQHWQEKDRICHQVTGELAELAQLHKRVTLVMKEFVAVVGPLINFTLLYNCFLFIYGIYFLYVPLVQDSRQHIPFVVEKYLHCFGTMTFQTFLFYFTVSGSAMLTNRAEQAAILLNRFFLCQTSDKLERTIEQWTTELLLHDFGVVNCGMYRINYTLMYSAASTITTTLIVMIQFQLTE